ncbi:MAG: hypothetical protein QG622_276 [Actinomycetota bacterium]|nr:hypothetical protein [Actinomycetota bacterium]
MPSFVITMFFDVGSRQTLPGRDVIAKWWGPGHQFSYCDDRGLTLIVEVVAPDQGCAFDEALSRAEALWGQLTDTALAAPSTVRVQKLSPQEKVISGPVGRGPDRIFAEAAAGRAARLKAAVAALSDLQAGVTALP